MENAEFMVSVIVLTYNHEKYIAQCLESILAQVFSFSMEVLVGDDCSTDGTSSIVKAYEAKYPNRLRVFVREVNMGATKNLYDLLSHTRGKYIASCEGDDYWTDPLKLQRQISFLEMHPDYMGCTHPCQIVNEYGALHEDQRLPWVCTKRHYTLKDFKGIYLPGQPATLVHRNFFLDRSHDYSIIYKANSMIADRTMIVILAAQGLIYRMNETMSCYRRQTEATTVTGRMFEQNETVNLMQLEFTKKLEYYLRQEYSIELNCVGFKMQQMLKHYFKKWMRGGGLK